MAKRIDRKSYWLGPRTLRLHSQNFWRRPIKTRSPHTMLEMFQIATQTPEVQKAFGCLLDLATVDPPTILIFGKVAELMIRRRKRKHRGKNGERSGPSKSAPSTTTRSTKVTP